MFSNILKGDTKTGGEKREQQKGDTTTLPLFFFFFFLFVETHSCGRMSNDESKLEWWVQAEEAPKYISLDIPTSPGRSSSPSPISSPIVETFQNDLSVFDENQIHLLNGFKELCLARQKQQEQEQPHETQQQQQQQVPQQTTSTTHHSHSSHDRKQVSDFKSIPQSSGTDPFSVVKEEEEPPSSIGHFHPSLSFPTSSSLSPKITSHELAPYSLEEKLRSILRIGGLTPSTRRCIWKQLVLHGSFTRYSPVSSSSSSRQQRSSSLCPSPSSSSSSSSSSPEFSVYQNLVSQWQTSPCLKIIGLDIPRTFPTHPTFRSEKCQSALGRILACYSLHRPKIGYAQSMNIIAGICYLVAEEDEEEAFEYLVFLLDILRDYHSPSLTGVRLAQATLEALIKAELPRLWHHLEAIQVDLRTASLQWLLCLLLKVLTVQLALKVWDSIFLSASDQPLLIGALAILAIHQTPLLECSAMAEVMDCLNNLVPQSILASTFFEIFLDLSIRFPSETYHSIRRESKTKLWPEICRIQRSRIVSLVAHDTDINFEDIDHLYTAMEKIVGQCIAEDPPVSLSMFQEILQSVFPNLFNRPIPIPQMYRSFDLNGDGSLSLRETLYGLAVIAFGTPQQRLRFFFRLCDVDRSGFVDRKELSDFLKNFYSSSKIPPSSFEGLPSPALKHSPPSSFPSRTTSEASSLTTQDSSVQNSSSSPPSVSTPLLQQSRSSENPSKQPHPFISRSSAPNLSRVKPSSSPPPPPSSSSTNSPEDGPLSSVLSSSPPLLSLSPSSPFSKEEFEEKQNYDEAACKSEEEEDNESRNTKENETISSVGVGEETHNVEGGALSSEIVKILDSNAGEDLFNFLDTDGDGELTCEEFERIVLAEPKVLDFFQFTTVAHSSSSTPPSSAPSSTSSTMKGLTSPLASLRTRAALWNIRSPTIHFGDLLSREKGEEGSTTTTTTTTTTESPPKKGGNPPAEWEKGNPGPSSPIMSIAGSLSRRLHMSPSRHSLRRPESPQSEKASSPAKSSEKSDESDFFSITSSSSSFFQPFSSTTPPLNRKQETVSMSLKKEEKFSKTKEEEPAAAEWRKERDRGGSDASGTKKNPRAIGGKTFQIGLRQKIGEEDRRSGHWNGFGGRRKKLGFPSVFSDDDEKTQQNHQSPQEDDTTVPTTPPCSPLGLSSPSTSSPSLKTTKFSPPMKMGMRRVFSGTFSPPPRPSSYDCKVPSDNDHHPHSPPTMSFFQTILGKNSDARSPPPPDVDDTTQSSSFFWSPPKLPLHNPKNEEPTPAPPRREHPPLRKSAPAASPPSKDFAEPFQLIEISLSSNLPFLLQLPSSPSPLSAAHPHHPCPPTPPLTFDNHNRSDIPKTLPSTKLLVWLPGWQTFWNWKQRFCSLIVVESSIFIEFGTSPSSSSSHQKAKEQSEAMANESTKSLLDLVQTASIVWLQLEKGAEIFVCDEKDLPNKAPAVDLSFVYPFCYRAPQDPKMEKREVYFGMQTSEDQHHWVSLLSDLCKNL